jgi:hypothetical protein
MRETPLPGCTVCGRERTIESGWFLLIESRWQDKVKILRWHDLLALQQGVHKVCCAAHVQELVVHWMATGSLDYPFARVKAPTIRSYVGRAMAPAELDTRAGQQIGELAIHRESIQRVLRESPHSLIAILDALLEALREEIPQPEISPACVEEQALVEQGVF